MNAKGVKGKGKGGKRQFVSKALPTFNYWQLYLLFSALYIIKLSFHIASYPPLQRLSSLTANFHRIFLACKSIIVRNYGHRESVHYHGSSRIDLLSALKQIFEESEMR